MSHTTLESTSRSKFQSLVKHPTTYVTNLSPMQKGYVSVGLIISLILLITIVNRADWIQGTLFIIGLALGATLLYARFGFTSAFRRLVSVGNVQGLQAHMLMFAVSTTLFAIILSTGFSFTGITPAGYVSPVGIPVIFGAFLFGIGMQLGNGCASGTLYNLGGGSSSMLLSLLFFIAGSTLGAYHLNFWMQETPTLPAISLATSTGLGYFGAWAIQIASICRDLLDYDSNCEKEKPSDDEATCDNNWMEKTISRFMAVICCGDCFSSTKRFNFNCKRNTLGNYICLCPMGRKILEYCWDRCCKLGLFYRSNR